MGEVKGSYIGGVPVLFKDEVARNAITDAYDSTRKYAVGEYCIYENLLRKCIAETTGIWDSTKWETTKFDAEIKKAVDTARNAESNVDALNEKMLQVKEYDLTLTYSSANVLRAVLTHGLGVTPKACTIKPWGTTGTIRNFGYVLSNDAPNGQTIQINALSSSKWVSGDELPVKVTLLYVTNF